MAVATERMEGQPSRALGMLQGNSRMGDEGADILQERMVGILTTIHFTLQSERVATISEANGRSALYLTAVSACLVALGFIAPSTALGSGFYLVVFILFAVLTIVGIITFARVVQSGLEDMISARGIARIRRFYAEVAPGIERWFVLPVQDEIRALHDEIGGGSRFQTLLTTASMVAVVTCALVGVLTSIAAFSLCGLPLAIAAIIGLAGFGVSGWLHYRYQVRAWREALAALMRA
ncbi:hypothetical protein RFN29_24875 [Mesorhizobium sp. VK22B]|uniref:ABC transmembrane type-1 domain-containing protein n=1 Tax=Mesorhizobium captivum TaxID=3072319 RepID=A0ABU4Z6F1_9HYPH|nr:hypothetical protein [Mesorhizobium sp. VK22B]MDX8494802.1 hypothetical protein [Mesorhizobium sp. VK22B]